MPGYDVRALDTLRLELKFLELGLYHAPASLFVFQDLPTYLRYCAAICPNCVLRQFVPSECRSGPVPCHHTRLNDAYETVDSLYRTGTPEKLEEALGKWLSATIQKLEEQQSQARNITGFEMSPRRSAA